MSSTTGALSAPIVFAEPQGPAWIRSLHKTENVVTAALLSALVILPLAEAFLRRVFRIGIPGSSSILQHLMLVLGMAGAAIAAREGRLISLATASLIRGRFAVAAGIFSSSVSVAVSILLCRASWDFVATEKEAGGTLVPGIPLWVVQAVLPVGYALITFRLLRRTAGGWFGRIAALVGAAAFVTAGGLASSAASRPITPALLILGAAVCLGAPLFALLGGATLILFWGADVPLAATAVEHYRLVVNPSFPTIPLFTLAGYFLSESGASLRLVRVFQTLAGRFRGGPAIVTVLVCAFFTSFTGASGVTILALGGLLLPVLLQAGYTERTALGLVTGSGAIGLLIPPCLPLILYAIVASVPIEQMFLGGILPGMLLVAAAAWLGVRQGPRVISIRPVFDGSAARRALWEAKWELLLPVVALGALLGGFATPVEAAALTALYAFVIEWVVHPEGRGWKGFEKVTVECGLLVGGILLILGVAMGFTNYLVDAQIPPRLTDWARASIHSPLVFLLFLNVLLLIVGALMDTFSAIVVVAPLITPIGAAFGIDPIHLGIVFLANLELGYLAPPVGENLFLSSYRFHKSVAEVFRSVIPIFLVLCLGVLLITYLPWLTTFLPRLFAK